MKKLLFVLVMLGCLLPAAAQVISVPGSLEKGLTAGTFENEVDFSFGASPAFGDFDKSLIFAALGNPMAGFSPYIEYTAFDSTFSFPLMFGYYSPKLLPVPFSGFAALEFDALDNRGIPHDSAVPTYSTKPVDSGTTTTNVAWTSGSVETLYTYLTLTDYWTTQFQALTRIGPAVLGFQLYLNKDNQDGDVAGAEAYFSETTTTAYHDTAGVDLDPVPELDYTSTEVVRNVDPAAALPAAGDAGLYAFTTDIRFAVPFAMKTGAADHRAALGLTIQSTDASAEYSDVESAHVHTAGGAAVNEDALSVTSTPSTVRISLDYELRLPARSGGGNIWMAGISADLGVNSNDYSFDHVNRDYNLSVLDVKTGIAGGTHESYVSTYSSTLDFDLDLTGSRTFDFAVGSGVAYRFAPTLGLGFTTTSNGEQALETERVSYTQVLDANGDYDGVTAYDRTTIAVTGDPAYTRSFGLGLALPTGLKLKPAGWPFSLLLGAEPSMNVATTRSTTAGTTSTATVDTITGDTVNATTITPTISSPVTTQQMTYRFSEEHYIGVSFTFDGGVRLDAALIGSLLDINNFVIQGVIPF